MITHAAALDTMLSSSATAWKSGFEEGGQCYVVGSRGGFEAYPTSIRISDAGDEESDLIDGLALGSHLDDVDDIVCSGLPCPVS